MGGALRGLKAVAVLSLVLGATSALAAGLAAADCVIPVGAGGSIQKALDEAGAVRATNAAARIEIVLSGKGYALAQPIVLDRSLQGDGAGELVIRPAGPARTKILGSRRVKGWSKLKGKMNGSGDVWVADVSSFELDDQLEALFLDGKLMTMARYPNFNPKMPYSGGWAYVPGRWRSMYKFIQGPDAPKRTEMPVGAKDWHDWQVPTEGRILIFPRQRFGSSYVRLADLDRAARKLVFASNLCDLPYPGDSYILSGFREELDAPGEWYHDLKGRRIYFIPPKGTSPDKGLVTIPAHESVVELKGASNVVFENLEFCAGLRAVTANGGRGCAFRGCVFRDLARHAVWLEGVRGFQVSDCDFFDLGKDAIRLRGNGSRLEPNGTTVENCYFHHLGRIDHIGRGIFMEGQGFRVRHNLFHDLPQWAVFHTGGWHELTDNRVHHYMLETEDGAAFYTCNYQGNRGTVIARNWISDGIGFGKVAGGIGPLDFYVNSHGLYFDAGPGDGRIFDNVIERVSCQAVKMNANRGQVVSNNVFTCIGRPNLLRWSYMMNLSGGPYDPKHEFCDDAKYERAVRADPWIRDHLVGMSRPPSDSPAADHNTCWSNRLERNIWHYPDCPDGTYVFVQGADVKANFIDCNLICPGKDGGDPKPRSDPGLTVIPWREEWQRKLGADVHSVVTKSIVFRNPKAGDFTLKNRALADKLGIRPLDMKGCGLYVSKFRPSLPKEADGCANHPEWLVRDRNHVNPTDEGGKKTK